MPKLFEYLGIIIRFYSDEHEPIHIHATYNENIIKVSFFLRDGKIYRVTYSVIVGKFPVAKLSELKEFITVYKDEIVKSWDSYFIWKNKVNFVRITKKI
jgi:hypothetical protein